jgi:hypothetical protein
MMKIDRPATTKAMNGETTAGMISLSSSPLPLTASKPCPAIAVTRMTSPLLIGQAFLMTTPSST